MSAAEKTAGAVCQWRLGKHDGRLGDLMLPGGLNSVRYGPDAFRLDSGSPQASEHDRWVLQAPRRIRSILAFKNVHHSAAHQ